MLAPGRADLSVRPVRCRPRRRGGGRPRLRAVPGCRSQGPCITRREETAAEESAAEEGMFSAAEESFQEEETVLPAEDIASQEMEAESLEDILRQAQDEDFGLDELPEMDEGLEEELAAIESPSAVEEEPGEEAAAQEEMLRCKKCGRSTPSAEKFCVNCGAKAR